MVFARRLRLLHARSRCSAMNIIMLQVGCRSGVYKNKCMVLCTLASSNGCVSASTRRETSHIDRPPRLAARRAAGPRRRAQQ